MSKTIADHKQRQQALHPGQSFIVQAPAGSGKTELLIQRYLKLLSLADAPEEIIAITFTRKAAAEMQGRILAAIESARDEKEPDQAHEKQTYTLGKAALERNEKRNWRIVENPGRLRIQTIDSLCAALTRQMPMLSGLGAQPEIVEDPVPRYEQAAVNTLAELESDNAWSDAIACLLAHLDNDLPRIRNLISDMLKKRDQWIPHVAKTHEREYLEQSLIHLIEEKLGIAKSLFPGEFETELCDLLRYAAKHMNNEGIESDVIHCQSIESLPGTSADDLEQWLGIAELLLTKTCGWRKRLNKTNGFPSPADNKLEKEERASMKKRIEGLIGQLREIEGLQQQLAEIKQLPPARYTDEEWKVVNALCRLLTLSEAQLRVIFAENNQMDFTGIAQAAINALGEDESPTDLALHLDYQIKHLLVDEYQDISVTQHRLIERITAEWSQDDGRSLFLVGDPMQSIYRFREAEVGIFTNTFHRQRLGQVRLNPLRLSVNFRSQQGIVEWVNNSFMEIFPEKDDVTTGAVSYSACTANNENSDKNAINLYPLFNKAGTQEAKQIYEIVQGIRDNDPQGTTAVLVRSRSHLFDIIPILQKKRVRFRAIEIEGMGSQQAVQDILALTRAWLHPADRIAWLAILRAPWCGLELSVLHALLNNDKRQTIWECLQNGDIIKRLSRSAQDRLKNFSTIFSEAFEQRQRRPLRQTIESLWCRLGGPASLSSENDLENITTYLDLLESLDNGGDIDDLDRLTEDVSNLYAAPDLNADESLQVMTIHKAKGLEFDHVVLPGLGRVPRTDQGDLLMWMLKPREGDGHDLILAPIREAGQNTAPIYDYVKKVEKEKQVFEDTRLLYVAITRAKKSVHLVGHAKIKTDKDSEEFCEADRRSLLNHLWPVVNDTFRDAMSKYSEETDPEDIVLVSNELKRLTPDWRLPEPPKGIDWNNKATIDETQIEPARIEYAWAGETIMHIGSIVHRSIQRIAEEGIDAWDESRIQSGRPYYALSLKRLGVPENEIDWACQRVQEALTGMINDKRGRWILHKEYEIQQNEYPVSGLHEGKLINVIIDRTFVDENDVRWVVDYKTSRHEGSDVVSFLDREQERHRQQLETYASLMRHLENRIIKLGLYFPLLRGWREWEYSKH